MASLLRNKFLHREYRWCCWPNVLLLI